MMIQMLHVQVWVYLVCMYQLCIKTFVLTRSLTRPIRKCKSNAKMTDSKKNAKNRVKNLLLANGVDMIQMLDIQAWVDLVYLSTVYQSICANSDSNTANTQVYVECENAPPPKKKLKIRCRIYFDKWCRHDTNARYSYSSVSRFSIYVSIHNVSLTESVVTTFTTFQTSNPSLRRPPTT